MIELISPAKINLILRVLYKRTDGFHEIYSVMQTVSLHDRIEWVWRDSAVTLTADVPGLSCDEDNLIIRAIRSFQCETAIEFGADIQLKKEIPIGGGMGGGSSNAGTVLQFLNRHFGEPVSIRRLGELAAQLGSDVPFFLHRGTALAEGRGEVITPVQPIDRLPLLLINPGFPVPTPMIYRGLNLNLTTPRQPLNIRPASRVDPAWTALVLDHISNDLEPVVVQQYPVIGEALDWLKKNGARRAIVSGSGGTVFGVFESIEQAEEARSAAEYRFQWVRCVETVD